MSKERMTGMNTLLIQLDGKLPNIALMRISAHHKARGDYVELRQAGNFSAAAVRLTDPPWDYIYISLIFERSKNLATMLLAQYSWSGEVLVGGTGWDYTTTLESYGIDTPEQDYSLYPNFKSSIGFTQRGCRLRCAFCVVPKKEGAVRENQTVAQLWRGDPYPRELLLLDNDFFGQPRWQDRIEEMRSGGFKVCFTQGINARMLNDETAAALASVDYRDDSMKVKRIYTAWDNQKDEARLFRGLDLLVKYGVKPDHIMVYILCGYWPGETQSDREYRRRRLREFGARPYPMPFVRTREIIGFQRWIIGAYDKTISWSDWVSANYEPRNLLMSQEVLAL